MNVKDLKIKDLWIKFLFRKEAFGKFIFRFFSGAYVCVCGMYGFRVYILRVCFLLFGKIKRIHKIKG